MGVESRFKALEAMCREKAAQADREMKYWLEEANEWKRLRETSADHIENVPLQLDWCAELINMAHPAGRFTTPYPPSTTSRATPGS